MRRQVSEDFSGEKTPWDRAEAPHSHTATCLCFSGCRVQQAEDQGLLQIPDSYPSVACRVRHGLQETMATARFAATTPLRFILLDGVFTPAELKRNKSCWLFCWFQSVARVADGTSDL